MNSDIRLRVNFLRHRKTRELRKRLGADAVLSLQQLWLNCATNFIDGYLPGEVAEVEHLADWTGSPGALVPVLIELRFLDDIEGELRIHDWSDHQPFVVDAEARIEQAHRAGRASAEARRRKFGTAQPLGGRGFGTGNYRTEAGLSSVTTEPPPDQTRPDQTGPPDLPAAASPPATGFSPEPNRIGLGSVTPLHPRKGGRKC